MENIYKTPQKTKQAFEPGSTQAQSILKKTNYIITNCDNTASFGTSGFNNTWLKSNGSKSSFMYFKKVAKPPSLLLGDYQPNLQEKQKTEKYVEKLRLNSKQMEKQPTIRKSDIGQNQLVFTNQQQLKLQVIDQFLQKGYELPEDPFNIELYPKPSIGNGQCQKADFQASLRQSNHPNPFSDQLYLFQQWGQTGNKQNILELIDDKNKQFVQTINFKQLEKSKHKNKKNKQQKVLNFTRNTRSQFSRNFKEIKQPKTRASIDINLNQSRGTVSGMNTVKQIEKDIGNQKVKIPPNLLSQFETEKYINMANQKLFRSMQPQKSSGLFKCQKINKKQISRFQWIQRIRQLQSVVNQKYLRIKNNIYMTPQRIQALYACQMIKEAKKIMSKKDYIDLRVAIGSSKYLQQKQLQKSIQCQRQRQRQKRSQLNYFDNCQVYIKRSQKQKDIKKANQQIQKILEKNKQRLKQQRQRVIQKLRF